MIIVKIELWPYGDESKKSDLGRIEIANDVTKTLTTGGSKGDYKVTLFQRGGKRVWRSLDIIDFPRKRLTAYDLVYRILKDVVGGRN